MSVSFICSNVDLDHLAKLLPADFSVPVVKCSVYLSEKSVTEGFLC